MINAILIDDEYYALAGLKRDLEELGIVRILAAFESGADALEQVASLQPELIFLDIEMPEMSGLELFDRLLELCPQAEVVFVTAYNQYAIQAFELNAMDYLLKPVQPERLEKTLGRLRRKEAVPPIKRLSLHCFGRFSIRADGVEQVIPWRTRKAEELLAYLACARGQFVSKEKLAETLWPGLPREKSKANFYLTCHYLKKQLEQAKLPLPVESERGKLRLNLAHLEVDIVSFEALVAPLDEVSDETVATAETAAALYNGPFLDGHYYEWSMEQSWRYELIYSELIRKLTAYHKIKGNRLKEAYFCKKSAQ